MFQHLNSSTYGANRSQYEYLSTVRALISILKILQQYNKSNEGISERLDSVSLKLKVVGGNIHP